MPLEKVDVLNELAWALLLLDQRRGQDLAFTAHHLGEVAR